MYLWEILNGLLGFEKKDQKHTPAKKNDCFFGCDCRTGL